MSDLADFLLARIAEDEALARANFGPYSWSNVASLIVDELHDDYLVAAEGLIRRYDPARVLAECEAKRRIVDEARIAAGDDSDHGWAVEHGDNAQQLAIHVMRLLALPYADHESYREEWRP